jgi:hypothetical protein
MELPWKNFKGMWRIQDAGGSGGIQQIACRARTAALSGLRLELSPRSGTLAGLPLAIPENRRVLSETD